MKAARLAALGSPLRVEQVPDPAIVPGSVLVRVLAAFVPPFTADLIEHGPPYQCPPLPFTPGIDAVGTVEVVAADVAGVVPGETVYCDHHYQTCWDAERNDECMIGYYGMGKGSRPLIERWRDGSYAEKVLLPSTCVAPLGGAVSLEPTVLCRLGWIGTAMGAYRRSGLQTGQTLIVNGATGVLGGRRGDACVGDGSPKGGRPWPQPCCARCACRT